MIKLADGSSGRLFELDKILVNRGKLYVLDNDVDVLFKKQMENDELIVPDNIDL